MIYSRAVIKPPSYAARIAGKHKKDVYHAQRKMYEDINNENKTENNKERAKPKRNLNKTIVYMIHISR